MKMVNPRFHWILAGLCCLGCGESGEPTAEVNGTVTLNGVPLSNAAISFYGPGGAPIRTASIDSDGSYETTAALGKNRVTIRFESAVKSDPSLTQFEGGVDPRATATKHPLPPEYSDYAATPLGFEVEADADNRFDITLP